MSKQGAAFHTHTDDGVHQSLDLRGLDQLQSSQSSVEMLLGFVTRGVLCKTLDTVIELQMIMLLACVINTNIIMNIRNKICCCSK